jgi:CRISPR-associated protein Csd1
MILQALKGYYDRKAADPESGIAPEGWEWKEIPFVVVLEEKGHLFQIEDTREGDGKQKRAKQFLVPQGVKKTSGIAANLLWDTANYVLGVGEKDEGKLAKQKQAFIERVQTEMPGSKRKNVILHFLSTINDATLEKLSQWEDIYKSNPNI